MPKPINQKLVTRLVDRRNEFGSALRIEPRALEVITNPVQIVRILISI